MSENKYDCRRYDNNVNTSHCPKHSSRPHIVDILPREVLEKKRRQCTEWATASNRDLPLYRGACRTEVSQTSCIEPLGASYFFTKKADILEDYSYMVSTSFAN